MRNDPPLLLIWNGKREVLVRSLLDDVMLEEVLITKQAGALVQMLSIRTTSSSNTSRQLGLRALISSRSIQLKFFPVDLLEDTDTCRVGVKHATRNALTAPHPHGPAFSGRGKFYQ